MSWLALDIGGANLKASNAAGYTESRPFALWKRPQDLAPALADLIDQAPPAENLAVTMTGELADCYENKQAGVAAILAACRHAAADRTVRVYLCNGELVSPEQARSEYLLASASNWHVLASYAVRHCPSVPALLVDIGSTTSDFIPLGSTGPVAEGSTDPQRLASGELVYSGVQRSPVCALVDTLPWQTHRCNVAQELFATAGDVYTLLGDIPEDGADTETADGRPRTKEHCQARVARMVCADASLFSRADAAHAAEEIRSAQEEKLAENLRRVMKRQESPAQSIVLSGEGEFLARRVLQRVGFRGEVISLGQILSPSESRCAPAYALAVLAAERFAADE